MSGVFSSLANGAFIIFKCSITEAVIGMVSSIRLMPLAVDSFFFFLICIMTLWISVLFTSALTLSVSASFFFS